MMGFTWYILGILTAGSGYFLYEYSKKHRLNRLSWPGLILGIFSILFSIAWAVGAMLEGVPRAASMGLLLFGLGGIVILAVAIRFISGQDR
jgi:vacuolar-type H+-ATPase subunit I/STV1